MARGAFWTIIVDDQPTAFRAAVREDLLPTLKQLQRQHPGAVIKWFQRGRLWETPGEAMDAAKPPRRGPDWRPGGMHKDPREQYKVPRDVKRARWAKQAAEGRGPWVKDATNTERRPQNADRGPRRSRPADAGRTQQAERTGPDAPKPTGGGRQPATGNRDRATSNARPTTSAAREDRRRPASPKPGGGGGRPGKPGYGRPTDARTRETRGESGKSFRPAWKPKGEATGPAHADRRRPASPRPAGGGRPDWRGDRKEPRDATPRSGGGSTRPVPPKPTGEGGPKRGKTWRVGEVPPADRKRRKDDE